MSSEDTLNVWVAEDRLLRERKSGGVLKLSGDAGRGRGAGWCTSVDAEKGRGGTKGFCFLCLYWRGGSSQPFLAAQGGRCEVMPEESHNRKCGVGAPV